MFSQHQYKKSAVQEEIDKLVYKHNEYIATAIKSYISAVFVKIDHCIKLLNLDSSAKYQVKLALVKTLSEINFLYGYTHKNLLKRLPPEFIDLEPDSFSAFIEKNKPCLQSIDQFVATTLGIKDKKNQLINTVTQIKEIINQYTNENKGQFINDFNKDADLFLAGAHDKNYLELRYQFNIHIASFLTQLQAKEVSYYSGRLFASYRRSNSSLQPMIDRARDLYDQFKSDDVGLLQSKLQ